MRYRAIATSSSIRKPVLLSRFRKNRTRLRVRLWLFYLVVASGLLISTPSHAATLSSLSLSGSMIGGSTQTLTGTITIARSSDPSDQGGVGKPGTDGTLSNRN